MIIRGILSSLTPTKVNGGQYMDVRLLLDDNVYVLKTVIRGQAHMQHHFSVNDSLIMN